MSALTLRAGWPIANMAESVSHILGALGDALAASRDYQHLQALSDRQLAERGLAREELPRLVFERHLR